MSRAAPAAAAELTGLVNTAHIGLESLAKLIGKQAQDFPQEDIENWKEKIRNLSRSSTVLSNEATVTKEVIDSEMGRLREKRKNRADADESETSAAAAVEEIKRLVKARSSSFKPDSAPFMKKINDILKKIGKNDEDDDEDIVVDDEEQENNFKCPVTTMRIVEPMTNGLCKHTISKAGVDLLSRRGSEFDCPVPGCRKRWSKSNARPDHDFQNRMERFFRLQAATNSVAAASQASTAIDLDDD